MAGMPDNVRTGQTVTLPAPEKKPAKDEKKAAKESRSESAPTKGKE